MPGVTLVAAGAACRMRLNAVVTFGAVIAVRALVRYLHRLFVVVHHVLSF